MNKELIIEKAKDMIITLTNYKWKDITTSVQMEERLNGIVEFVSFALLPSAKELETLKNLAEKRLEYWKNKK